MRINKYSQEKETTMSKKSKSELNNLRVNASLLPIDENGQTEQTLLELEGNSPEKLGGKPLSRKEKLAKEEAERLASFKLYLVETTEVPLAIPLSSLIPLDTTPIKDASLAIRKLDKEHLSHMISAYEEGTTFPPIKVVATTWGFAVVGGYHRWTVYQKHCEKLNIAEDAFTIGVEPLNILDHTEIVKAAFKDNLTHGLAMSTTSRSAFGAWLIAEAASRGIELGLRAAAREAGIAHTTLKEHLERIEKQVKATMSDSVVSLTDDEQADVAAQVEQDKIVAENEKLAKAFTKLFKAITEIEKQCSEVPTDEMVSSLKGQIPDDFQKGLLVKYGHILEQSGMLFPTLLKPR